MGKIVKSKWNSVGNIDPKRFALSLQAEMNNRADRICEIAIRDVANQVLEKALQYVPVEEGDLYNTGRVDVVEKRGSNWYAEVVFGSAEVNYAFFVEFDMPSGVSKTYTKPGTGAGYLTRAGDEILTNETFNAALRDAARQVGG